MTIRLALATLRHRSTGFAGAFVALFCAAALVCGCGTLLATGLAGSLRPERYAAAPIVVGGDQEVHVAEVKDSGKVKVKTKPIAGRAWVSAALAGRIRALPSVRSAVTEVTFPALLPESPKGESWGHGWESAPLAGLTLASGRAPAAADEVVADAGTAARSRLRVGSTVRAGLVSGSVELRVVGVTAQGFADQSALYFAPARARQLAGHDGLVSAIGVFPAGPGAEAEVRRLVAASTSVPAAVVRVGDDRAAAEFPEAAGARVRLVSIGAVLAGNALLVALLVVVGTFGLSIQQRQREIAVLRAVGATARQLRRTIGGEALLLGLAAGSLGAVAGLPLGGLLRERFVALGVVPADLPLVRSPVVALAAAAATLVAGWAASLLSARRATAVRPVEALGEAELRPPRVSLGRWLCGVGALLGAGVLTALLTVLHTDAAASPVCFVAALLWCTALALLGPAVARAATAVLAVPLRASGVSGYLAAHNLRAGAHRLASVVVPLTLLTAMACTILFSQSTVDRAGTTERGRGTLADLVVGPRVPADAVAAVAAVPGVRAVTEVLHTQAREGLEQRSVQAVTPRQLAGTLDLGVSAGDLRRLAPDTAAVAEGLGHGLGDRLHLVLADGTPAQVTVVALYRRGLGFGDLTLDRALVAPHVDVPLDDELLLRAGGSSRAAVAAALRDEPGIGVLDRASAQAGQSRTSEQIGYVMLALIAAFVAIAVLNTLAMSIGDRRREFAALARTGATGRQIRGMLGRETAVAVVLAAGLGLAIAGGVLSAYAQGITRGLIGPAVPPVRLGEVLGGVVLLAVAGTWVAARSALRGPLRAA